MGHIGLPAAYTFTVNVTGDYILPYTNRKCRCLSVLQGRIRS